MPGTTECERVVRIPEERNQQAEKARVAIHRALSNEGVLNDREFAVAVLAQLARELLTQESNSVDKE
jgi:hypothetical protein